LEGEVNLEQSEVLKLDNQLCFALYACAREMNKLYYPLLKEIGLTYTQYITLLALWESPRLTVKELGERLILDSGTLTPLLKKLEQMGHVTRTRDPRDERSVIIGLTKQGDELRASAFEIPLKLYCQAGVGMDEAESLRKTLSSLLSKVRTKTRSEEMID
jgi:DNA-binding MarR family transcriptional regulator